MNAPVLTRSMLAPVHPVTPDVSRIEPLLLAYQAAMRIGNHDAAKRFGRQLDGLAWDLVKVTGSLTEAAETARIIALEGA